jgi:AcrR family transcriptional regulator
MHESSATLDRRENGKLDKRRRIAAAARAAFTELGYEGASMREIAKRAGVATGTLFLYAPDKRSLLLWILDEDLHRVTEVSFGALAAASPEDDLLDQLLFIFEARYRYWGSDPDLALHGLIMARDSHVTPESRIAYYENRRRPLQGRLRELVRAQQARGTIRADEDPEIVAQLIHAIYNGALRVWLRSDKVDVEAGIHKLRQLLRLALEGVSVTAERGVGGRLN